jgi:hypothetical protein
MHRIAVFVGFARFKFNELAANPAHLAWMWESDHDQIPPVNRISQTLLPRLGFSRQYLESMQCVLQLGSFLSMVAIAFYFS